MAINDAGASNPGGLTDEEQSAADAMFESDESAQPQKPGLFSRAWTGLAGIPHGIATEGLQAGQAVTKLYQEGVEPELDVGAGLIRMTQAAQGSIGAPMQYANPQALADAFTYKPAEQAGDEAQNALESWRRRSDEYFRPNPQTTGIVGNALYGLTDAATRVTVDNLIAPGAGIGLAAASEGAERTQDLEAQRVDANTATEEGVLQGGAFLAMGQAGGIGGSMLRRMVAGAISNEALSAGATAADSAILRAHGYTQLADQQHWNDAASLISNGLLSVFFSALPHEEGLPSPHAISGAADAVDSALAQKNAAHVMETAPGVPTDIPSQRAHVQALDAAAEQMVNGDDVNIAPIVRGMNTIPRPVPEGLPEAVDEVFSPRGPVAASEADLARLDELRQQRAGTAPLTGEELGEFADLSERDRLTARIAGSGARIPGVLNMEAFSPADHGQVGFVDADNFKEINDQLGHATGDELIQNMGQILSQEAAPGTVFHRGGDEFLLSGDQQDIDDVMQRVNDRLAQRVLEVTGSDGQTHQRSVFLSHGIGENEADAERQLHAAKAERLAAGFRTERRATERPDDAGRRDQGTAGAGRPADAHPADSETAADLNLAGGVSASGADASIRSSDAAYGTPERHPWVELDTSKNIPLAGGVSRDGHTVYISPYMPKTVDVDGKTVDAEKGVFVHEVEEQKVMLPDGPKDAEYMAALRADIEAEHAKIPEADLEKVEKGIPLPYPNAHAIATVRENAFIRKTYGVDPHKYQRALTDGIEEARKKAAEEGNIPADLDPKPYEDSGLTKLLPDDQGAADAMRQADEDVAEAGRLAAGIKAAVQCFLSYGSELT